MSAESEIKDLVFRSCLTLDRRQYNDYLELFSTDMRYRVVTYSPELRKEMVWLDHDLGEMKHLFKMLPQHVTLKGEFFRHATVYEITRSKGNCRVVTSLMLIYTGLDGISQLMAVGYYQDQIREEDGRLFIERRDVQLETRDLGPGLHTPL